MPGRTTSSKGREGTDQGFERRLPDLPPTSPHGKVIAILCADLHLSHKPPLARSVEKDWYGCMTRSLMELRSLAEEHKADIICAGDVLDTPRQPPELINFLIRHMPVMYAVPGQHDLLHHAYEDIDKTSYWTLAETGTLWDLEPNFPCQAGKFRLWGFPWNHKPQMCQSPHGLAKDIAVIHRMFWTQKSGYLGAPGDRRASAYKDMLQGYDIAIFGDNHKPCCCRVGDCLCFNPGSFMRRKADEREHKPSVGLLYEDSTIKRHYLDCSQDKFLEQEKLQGLPGSLVRKMEIFIGELAGLDSEQIDIKDLLLRFMIREKIPGGVQKIVLQSLKEK